MSKRVWWVLGGIAVLGVIKLAYNLTQEAKHIQGVMDAQRGVPLAEDDPRIGKNTFDLPKGYEQFMPDLKRGAYGLIQTGACESIDLADLSTKYKSKTNPTFFYYCNNGDKTNVVHLTLNEIRAGDLPMK